MIEFEQVTKRYDDGTVAVDGVELVAAKGKITVFVGPSGCGKTTSLRMINRMVEPTGGRILINGDDVRKKPAAHLRRDIGYVIQHAGLFPHRTVLDNIGTVPRLQGWSRSRARGRAAELLEVVGLDPALGKRYPAQLSGGQQQRVGVARALAADPPVLLMDEPFSAVDPVVRDGLQEELLRLQNELGKTIVFVTHDIDEAVRLGDAIAVFAPHGRLAQVAPPAELLAEPATEFVSDFIGKDRGYRGLSFVDTDDLAVDDLQTVSLGSDVEASDGWRLAVDSDGKPAGWLAPSTEGGKVTAERLSKGKSLHRQGASLRSALDAALSSPSGEGVVIDDGGAVVGGVRANDVLTLLAGR